VAIAGWRVEPGETIAEALARELEEEGNIEILKPPVLHGLFFNSRVSQRDHVDYLLCAPSASSACRYPIGRLPHTAFFLSTLFLRIRLLEHAPHREVMLAAPLSERW